IEDLCNEAITSHFLNLGNKKLTEIPPELFEVSELESELEVLLLNRNQLTKVPGEIGKLSGLKLLQLNANKLTNLPNELVLMTNLVGLDVSMNLIRELPDGVYTKLTNLLYLNLSSN